MSHQPIIDQSSNQEVNLSLTLSNQNQGVVLEIFWLKTIIDQRIKTYFDSKHIAFSQIPPPQFKEGCHYSRFLSQNGITDAKDRLLLALALCKKLRPEILDVFCSKNEITDMPYSEFGGHNNGQSNGFVPTLQTAFFLLSGDDIIENIAAISLYTPAHPLFKNNILTTEEVNDFSNTNLSLSERSTYGLFKPEQREEVLLSKLAAKKLQTKLSWHDLVLPNITRERLNEIELWLRYGEILLQDWEMNNRFNSGYKALFYGPPGTGKTLTATLLGTLVEQCVYRIDLSKLVSKYIGETSKNLDEIFEKAEKQKWILFFDEADSLFAKRTNVTNSNDRHANQETAHLLQRIEMCENLVILASNLKDNMDEAFLRRFQSIVYFPKPGPKERMAIWTKGFSQQADVSELDFSTLAKNFDLTGAEIMNVIRVSSLLTIKQDKCKVAMEDVISAIRQEKMKSGQII